ncbi:hypothetical protein AOLI_G00133440 [Acnodon oligacanthus]
MTCDGKTPWCPPGKIKLLVVVFNPPQFDWLQQQLAVANSITGTNDPSVPPFISRQGITRLNPGSCPALLPTASVPNATAAACPTHDAEMLRMRGTKNKRANSPPR